MKLLIVAIIIALVIIIIGYIVLQLKNIGFVDTNKSFDLVEEGVEDWKRYFLFEEYNNEGRYYLEVTNSSLVVVYDKLKGTTKKNDDGEYSFSDDNQGFIWFNLNYFEGSREEAEAVMKDIVNYLNMEQ